jgi:nucleoside-diphosphate-sugar epimerase
MKRALVTGGTGFVGANLVRRLLGDGHEVHCTVQPGHSIWRLEPIQADVHLHEADIADRGRLAPVLRGIRPEWIFHLAVYGAYSWQADLDRMVRTNVLGTINLVETCLDLGFDAFVNTGSSSEYGAKDHAPAETELLEPNSHYAVTKASATLFCRHTARRRGRRLPTLRLYSVYGPWEEPGRLVPTLVVRGLAGELPRLAAPETERDFVYVDDVCDAYLLAAERGDQPGAAIYNVGTAVGTSLRELVEVARRLFGIEAEPAWGSMPAREWDTDVWVADNTLIGEALGWRPRHDVEAGLRRTLDWFRACPSLVERYAAPVRS